MLKIKLSRIGKKKAPMYRLIIQEQARDPYGRSLEILGSYNPFSKELQAKTERIKYWLSQGAQMTPTVNNLLVEKKVIEGEKVKASINRKKEEPQKQETKTKNDSAPASKEETAEEKPATEDKTEEAKEEKVEEETKEVEKVKEEKAGEVEEEKKEETKEEKPAE